MGILCYILGRSGTGKSYSMRNFPKDKLAVVNVQGKILPFKGSGQVEMTSTDTSNDIVNALKDYARDYKSIVVDDFQYVMANEFMRRSTEKGYDKFTEIGRHAWDIANTVRSLPSDCIVYVMCHTDRDDEGNEKIKTIGKLLDEKICLEGMSTIVLITNVTDGVYTFLTQNNGKNTVKSPAGMFPSYAINNDLWYVDQKIRAYYELGSSLSAEEEAELDAAAKREGVTKEGKKKRRSKTEDTTPAPETETAEVPAEEKPASRRKKKGLVEQQIEAAVNDIPEDSDQEDVPFEETKEPELPKRKSRRKKAEETPMNPPTATGTQYWKDAEGKVKVINAGDEIPNPADGWTELTKEQYEAAVNPPTNVETPEGGRRRRRRRTTE